MCMYSKSSIYLFSIYLLALYPAIDGIDPANDTSIKYYKKEKSK